MHAPPLPVADLELRLDRAGAGSYAVSAGLRLPESDAPSDPLGGQPAVVSLEAAPLLAAQHDAEAYGRELTARLFGGRLAAALAAARAAARAQGLPLRLRLRLPSDDDALHALRWELLRAPEPGGGPLATSERVLLSRFVPSSDAAPYRPPTRRALRALVAAAAPQDLEAFGLAPFDAGAAVERAGSALGADQLARLASPVAPVTPARLLEALRDEPDLLCLVAHGALAGDAPLLVLEDDRRRALRVDAASLLDQLPALPRLVVLMSCEGAGDGTYAALAALGPRLARAGAPAVVAMQGRIGLGPALAFLETLMGELRRDGQIDRAVAAARAALRDTPDWWRPALWMRLASGRLWVPAAEEPPAFDTAPPSPLPDLFPPADSPIGRGGDLVELCSLFEAIRRTRRGRVACVAGRPGYGRAALSRAVCAYAEERGALVLRLRFWPTARLSEARRAALWDEDPLLSPDLAALEPQVAAQWPAAARLAGPGWVRLVAQAAPLLGAVPTRASERVAEDSPRALAAILRTLARRAPLILSVEGLDEAPPPWLDLLHYIQAELARDWPALLLATLHADQEPASVPETQRGEALAWAINLAERGAADLRWLGPVGVADVADYVGPAEPGLARRLAELSEGCPTLVEAIWAEWREQGAALWDDEAGVWTADPGMPQVYGALRDQAHAWMGALLPPGAPLDMDEAGAAAVLACAALEGQAFTAQAVAAARGLEAEQVLELCDSLCGDEERPGLLEEVGFVPVPGRPLGACPNVYRFSYLYLWLVWRDYGPQGGERAALQGRLAEALEAAYRPAADKVAGALIRLFEGAGLPERAAPYRRRGERAADRAVLRFQVETLAALPQPSPWDALRLYELRVRLSEQLRHAGEYAESLELAEAALAQARAWEDREREARSRYQIGMVGSELGFYVPAERELRQALAIEQQVLGSGHPSIATTLYALGVVRHAQGDYPAAENYFRQALVIEQRALGHHHPQTAFTLNALGAVRHAQGDYLAAEDLLRQALAIRQRVIGPHHPQTASTLHELGAVRHAQGDYPAAEDYLRQALAIRQQVLGPHHPQTASTLHELGAVRRDQGDYPAAEDYLRQSLAIFRASLAPTHPSIKTVLQNLERVQAKLREQGGEAPETSPPSQ